VPFQLRKLGTGSGQWKPEEKMTGLAAETMPAITAAAGRRMPNSTTVASHSRPTVAGVETLLTLPRNVASITPPTPATAAESANTASLVRTGDTPEVDAAGSDERTAAMPRPVAERWRLRISSVTTPMTASRKNAKVLLSARSKGPNVGRSIDQPAVPLRTHSQAKST
jgi:hypothetical protein